MSVLTLKFFLPTAALVALAGCGPTNTATRTDTNTKTDHVVKKPVNENEIPDQADPDNTTDKSNQEADTAPEIDEDVTIDDVTSTVQEFVRQEKQEYEKEVREQLSGIDNYLSDVKEDVTDRQELREQVKQLRQQVEDQLKELNEDTAESWEQLRESTNQSLEELNQAMEELKKTDQTPFVDDPEDGTPTESPQPPSSDDSQPETEVNSNDSLKI